MVERIYACYAPIIFLSITVLVLFLIMYDLIDVTPDFIVIRKETRGFIDTLSCSSFGQDYLWYFGDG
jgi:hypothetical protein